MKDCVFCKISRGEIEAVKVFENEDIPAFLDIAPINAGHTIIIPKEHHESLSTLDPSIKLQLIDIAGKIGQAMIRTSECDGYNLHLSHGECAGQAIKHCHIHVIPRAGTDGFYWNWRSLQYNTGEAQQIADKIKSRLKL